MCTIYSVTIKIVAVATMGMVVLSVVDIAIP